MELNDRSCQTPAIAILELFASPSRGDRSECVLDRRDAQGSCAYQHY